MAQRRARMPYAERHQQILEVATQVIGTLGYNGFTLKDVADKCGMSVAGMLHYFPSKIELLLALLGERDKRDFGAVAEQHGIEYEQLEDDDVPLTFPERLTLLHYLVERNSRQPDIVRLYSLLRTESMWDGHPAHDFFRKRDAWVLESFTRWFRNEVPHPESFGRQLLALMGGLEEQWLLHPEEVDLVLEWDRAIQALVPSWKPPQEGKTG